MVVKITWLRVPQCNGSSSKWSSIIGSSQCVSLCGRAIISKQTTNDPPLSVDWTNYGNRRTWGHRYAWIYARVTLWGRRHGSIISLVWMSFNWPQPHHPRACTTITKASGLSATLWLEKTKWFWCQREGSTFLHVSVFIARRILLALLTK